MHTQFFRAESVQSRIALTMLCAAALLTSTTAVSAQAPPVQSNVFNWTDIPQNQDVPIVHAQFDQGGYHLTDSAGETIVVPFHHNLYCMKFAVSPDGTTYFVNDDGDVPILYMPRHAYVDNATVPGARWYPFSPSWAPEQPVYLGIAPSWDAYVNMGWYPHMTYWGGYWGGGPGWHAGLFVAIPGLYFSIGGHDFWGWSNYHSYYYDHPGWYHPAVYQTNIYVWVNRPWSQRAAWGAHRYGWGHPNVFVHNGGPHPWATRQVVWHGPGSHSFVAPVRPAGRYYGTGAPGHTATWHGGGATPGGHQFTGARAPAHGGGSFGGQRHFMGASGGSFGGHTATYHGGGASTGSRHFEGAGGGSFGGSHNYSSHSFSGGGHTTTYHGGGAPSGGRHFEGASGSYGGTHSYSSHSFNGGGGSHTTTYHGGSFGGSHGGGGGGHPQGGGGNHSNHPDHQH